MTKTRVAGGAERFHRGDGVALAIEVALHRIGDADTADQQGRQSNQREELRETLHITLKRGRRIAARADLPAGFRQLLLRVGHERRRVMVARVVLGQFHPVSPAHEAARLHKTSGAQSRVIHQKTRAKADAARELVGFVAQGGADFEGRRPNTVCARPAADRAAPAKPDRRRRRKRRRVRRRHRARAWPVRRRRCRPADRRRRPALISTRDILSADARAIARIVAATETCPRLCRKRNSSSLASRWISEKAASPPRMVRPSRARPLVRLSENDPTPADRHHAERDAENQNVEAANAATQFAQCKTKCDQRRRARRRHRLGVNAHARTAARLSAGSMRPERNRTTRLQRAANVWSCVTRMSVVPRSTCPLNRRSITCRPVLSSRLPVGSSATRMEGPGANARASATRCCSPPESCAG